MSAKEIKSRLKAAKAAVDKKDFEEALKQCQVGLYNLWLSAECEWALFGILTIYLQTLFQLDALNYNGHVFAGLACLQLGKYEESKQYYKTAIAQQPDGPLAWKVRVCYASVDWTRNGLTAQ